jgi:Concanavalin A-like lectin/glucanases superfamily
MAEFKFFCPQCGRHIQCDTSYSGTQIDCPVCKQPIVVPQPPRSASSVQPPVPAKSRRLKNIMVIAASMFVLAGLVIGGWYGYSKIKIHNARGRLPPGLVALWSGEGGGKDSVGGNNGILTKISFADGKKGKAFVFKGSNPKIRVPASPSLNVGLGDGLTIAAWIKPANLNLQELFEWNQNDGVSYGAAQIGTHMEINEAPGDGSLWGNIVDTSAVSHAIHSENGIIIPNRFQHIAMTYDKTGGMAVLYLNGVVVAIADLGVFTPQTNFDFFMGTRPSGFFTGIYFHGAMDEIGVFNRALSASEIRAVYAGQK